MTDREITALYDAFARRLISIILYQCGAQHRTAIEDACQTAWCQLWRHRERVAPGAARAWLVVTARRAAWTLAAREAPVARYIDFELDERVGHIASPAPDPCEAACLRERLRLADCLPPQREALWLQAAGYDYGEIAIATGASHRTVERRLLRGRARLRAAA